MLLSDYIQQLEELAARIAVDLLEDLPPCERERLDRALDSAGARLVGARCSLEQLGNVYCILHQDSLDLLRCETRR